MQFVINSISKSMQLWNHQAQEKLGNFSIQFDICPYDDWHININEDLILCNDNYYESHKEGIGKRKKIPGYLSIHNRDSLSEEELDQIGDSFGIAICSTFSGDGIINYQVFLKEKAFESLLNQLSPKQNIELFISIENKDSVFTVESFDSREQSWNVQNNVNKQLPIHMFSLNLHL